MYYNVLKLPNGFATFTPTNMSDQPRTRQELYDRIRQMGREEFILEEMIRYGFWPAQGEIPQDPADEIRRQGEIRRELEALRSESRQLQN